MLCSFVVDICFFAGILILMTSKNGAPFQKAVELKYENLLIIYGGTEDLYVCGGGGHFFKMLRSNIDKVRTCNIKHLGCVTLSPKTKPFPFTLFVEFRFANRLPEVDFTTTLHLPCVLLVIFGVSMCSSFRSKLFFEAAIWILFFALVGLPSSRVVPLIL